jgi:hypothetical protein
MRRARAIAFAAALIIVAAPARPEGQLPVSLDILGNVTNAAKPVANALVVALNLASFEAIQTYTSPDGSFQLPALQSGIYKIIALKYGFAPATTTVLPGQATQRVTLKMSSEKAVTGRKKVNQELWELRGSLPADVLREIDLVMAPPQQVATSNSSSYDMPRFRGEMVSMTASGNGGQYAQTGVGVQSRLGDGWQIGIRGDLQRIDDPSALTESGGPAAEASVMEMELRSSPTTAYRVATTQSSWRYRETAEESGQSAAQLRSHNFEWEHGEARVRVHYLAHDNLFTQGPGSDVLEIAGATNVISTRRNDLGVSLRVRQESLRSSNLEPLRSANVAARGSVAVAPTFAVQYGVSSRLGVDSSEWAPRTGFEWRVDDRTSLVASVEYKMLDQSASAGAIVPGLVGWSDDQYALPRYSYSFGFVSSRNENNQFSAIATVTAADEAMRIVFHDGFSQFWDGLYIESGDLRRDIRLAYRRDFGPHFAIDVATTAGTATPEAQSERLEKSYVIGDVQTIFVPTGTTLAVSYREIQQPQAANLPEYHSARMYVRMAQSLWLPIDMKLLLGVELARVENSPFLLDPMVSDDETARRYMGGLALNF